MIRRILIIDSDIAFTISLKRALEETGQYEVRTVTRLSPAVNAMEEEAYDVALIDVQLDLAKSGEVIQALRHINPELPIILTSPYDEDRDRVDALLGQAFIKKRFVARALIPLIEQVVAAGYSPYTAETRAHDPIIIPEDEAEIDALLEQSRQNQALQEVPLGAGDGTISSVIDRARDPEVSQRIQTAAMGEPLATEDIPDLLPEPESEDEDSEPTPAENVLASTTQPDELFKALRREKGSTEPNAPLGSISQIVKQLTPPDELPDMQHIDPLPVDEETFSFRSAMPRPPSLPEQAFIESQPAARTESPIGEDLIPATVESITQQIIAIDEADLHPPVSSTGIPDWMLAHYALQLTQFSLESSAQGTLLTRNNDILARAGDIDDRTWQTIHQLITEAWSRPGDAKTRLIYRRLPMGEMLLYSVQTIDNQMLTLIFAADTSLKLIRKQAGRLNQALQTVPEKTAGMPAVDLPAPPPAAAPVAEAAPPAEVTPQPEPVVEAAPRTAYACFWMLDDQRQPMSHHLIDQLRGWLEQFAAKHDWHITRIDLQPDWVSLHVAVPDGTLPSDLVESLMAQSAAYLQELEPDRATPIWSDGYLVTTPAEAPGQDEINRFVQFYRQSRTEVDG